MDTKQQRILLRVVEAAEMLSLGRSKTYALVQAGEIPSIKIGGSLRIPVDSLNDWLKRHIENAVSAVSK